MSNQEVDSVDYNQLEIMYLELQKEFEQLQQSNYVASRDLAVQKALLNDIQDECKMVEERRLKKQSDHEAKLLAMEFKLSELKQAQFQELGLLNSQLSQLKSKNSSLIKEENELARAKEKGRQTLTSPPYRNSIVAAKAVLTKEIEEYEVKKCDLQEQKQAFQNEILIREQQLNEYGESLKSKTQRLREVKAQVDELIGELAATKQELDILKNKPLPKGSKGNSLFARVDDKRVQLEQTVNDIKSNYVKLQQINHHQEKEVSFLRKEISDLLVKWNDDTQYIEDYYNKTIALLVEDIENTKDMLKSLRIEASDQTADCSASKLKDLKFYLETVMSKENEIRKLEDRLCNLPCQVYDLSVLVTEAGKELRRLKLEKFKLELLIEETTEKVI